ncbi:prepilin-type N-terminal cleavage/methylation domain-containing protein [Candidatus Peregrinibacteria bacterium]|nr:prepilin-type N-terminal cleavage/methylation domain-containing protein [Candidatus Peregrinibacteria bacterium]
MKMKKNEKGFTLTEVLIGMALLVTAIVAATNLLIGLIGTNKTVVQTMQAYYFAEEGIEAMRNFRDTNWLNNVDFLGNSDVLGRVEPGGSYVVGVASEGWRNSAKSSAKDLLMFRPWKIESQLEFNSKICLIEEAGAHYFGSCGLNDKETAFERVIEVQPYCEGVEKICEDSVLVRSTVSFGENEVQLEELLTNWKGGAI